MRLGTVGMAWFEKRSTTAGFDKPTSDELGFGPLCDLLPDGVVVVGGDGRIILTNPSACEMFGYAAEELDGAPVDRLLPEPLRDIHEEHRQRYVEQPVMRPMGVGLELYALRKDGTQFPVEISLSPLEVAGQLLTTAIVRDITERKAAQEEQARLLREARNAWQHFEGLIESAPDAVVIVGGTGEIIRINRQAELMFGYQRDDLHGLPVEVLIPQRFRSVHVHHRTAYVDNPTTRPMGVGLELYGLHRDGREIPVEISLSALETDGRVFVKSIIRDVSDRREREQELQESARTLQERTAELETVNRELESFSYSVSHDLRAPLRSIDGFSQALLEDYSDAVDARGQRYLRHVREAAQEMGDLIDDLLHLSRVTRGDLQRAETSLSAIVASIRDGLENSDPEREVAWTIEEGVVVVGDERLLRIAMENLLGNAWKFTRHRERAEISFERRTESGEVRYIVRDNGAGFDMKYVGKLFGPFQRLHGASEFEGTGIGLATVQRIIHRHGGRIWAEGEVDHGATITFTLIE